MAKDDKLDAAEIRRWMLAALEQGKEEGYVLEEAMSLFQGLARPQAKMFLDSVVPGRTPENPVMLPFDETPRRRAAPHLDRLAAVQQEDAALRAGGQPGRIRRPGMTHVGDEHVLFHKGKRNIFRVKPLCSHNGKKFVCVTHGKKFATEAEFLAHTQGDADDHNTVDTDFDAPSHGEGHVKAMWCEHTSRETTQNFMGALEPLWIQHGLEAPKE